MNYGVWTWGAVTFVAAPILTGCIMKIPPWHSIWYGPIAAFIAAVLCIVMGQVMIETVGDEPRQKFAKASSGWLHKLFCVISCLSAGILLGLTTPQNFVMMAAVNLTDILFSCAKERHDARTAQTKS